MSQPSVFPDEYFPVEYWVLEYFPLSIGSAPVIDIHGCVDLNDLLASDVTVTDVSYFDAIISDEKINAIALSDEVCPP